LEKRRQALSAFMGTLEDLSKIAIRYFPIAGNYLKEEKR
jgi:hypothetical protein